MMETNLNYRQFLIKSLELKQARNPAFSVGAFGRLFNIDASRMGQILNGKVGISLRRANEIADGLKLSENDKRIFLLMVQAEHDRSPNRREMAKMKIKQLTDEFKDIDDIFNSIADWYHHAIIEYINLKPNHHDPIEIAEYFGISVNLVTNALSRLLDLKLISSSTNESNRITYKVLDNNRRTGQDIPSEAVKILNEQMLEKAAYELRKQNISNRDYSVVFLKMNKEQLQKAKDKIRDFRREFLKEFEACPDKDSIYSLSIQFFELIGSNEKFASDKLK